MSYQSLELHVEDHIARLKLNQPERGNPFDARLCDEFSAVANELSGRRDVRCVLVTATGKFFSVGGDLQTFGKNLDNLSGVIRGLTTTMHMATARFARLNAPIVACVQGTAMGGAVGFLSNCDLIYSGQSARFGAAYSQLGFSCDAGSSTGLAARMGSARARRFLLLSEMLSSEDALASGLVDYVAADADVLAEAEKAASKIAQGPTRAYGAIRRLLSRATANPLEAQLEDESQQLTSVATSADAREGVLAFVEKRAANFTGN